MISRLAPVWGATLAVFLMVPAAFAVEPAEVAAAPEAAPAAEQGGVDAPTAMAEATPVANADVSGSDALAADMAEAVEPAAEEAAVAEATDSTEPAAPEPDAEVEGTVAATDPSVPAAPAPAPAKPAVVLGEVGYDELGRPGRIHIVVRGDTLWDISDAYLGTPWVWPSIWTDNDDIQNPHLILPKDRIWITPYEMRRISKEEADALLAGSPGADEVEPLDSEPVPADVAPRTYRVASIEASGLITSEQLEASASIIDSVGPRVMMSQPDDVYIGYGRDEAAVGDEFTVFRTREKIFDPDTNRLLGYHVDILGWVEVTKPDDETSIAIIRQSNSEMEVGDRILAREPLQREIEVMDPPQGVEGKLSFFPKGRTHMGSDDFVYLNRGEMDGLQVGSPLTVYRPGWNGPERARNERVRIPDLPIADLLVVTARPETAVAVVTHTTTELELGDSFRGGEMFATTIPVSDAAGGREDASE
jgi:hypothetical protein